MNIIPVRAKIYQDAYRATLATTGDSAKAHQAGVEAVERAVAFYNKKAAAEQATKAATVNPRLLDPRKRAELLQADPELAEVLDAQVGWPKKKPKKLAAGWDGRILNEFLVPDVDPRVELTEKAERLADAKKIDFLAALAQVKVSEPALVERVAEFNRQL
jgi:hypothetical protein